MSHDDYTTRPSTSITTTHALEHSGARFLGDSPPPAQRAQTARASTSAGTGRRHAGETWGASLSLAGSTARSLHTGRVAMNVGVLDDLDPFLEKNAGPRAASVDTLAAGLYLPPSLLLV